MNVCLKTSLNKRKIESDDPEDDDSTNTVASKRTKPGADDDECVSTTTLSSCPDTSIVSKTVEEDIYSCQPSTSAMTSQERRFSDSINPLGYLSQNDLDSLQREADEMSDDSDDNDDAGSKDNDADELGSDDATLRQQVE